MASENSPRLVSLDAYRGFIMLAMASGGLSFAKVAAHFDGSDALSRFWQTLGYQFDHTAWTGCSFWDLIQPSFMFMVGVALPYSFASRRAKGETPGTIAGHAVVRAIVLILLGVFLSSNWSKQTNFAFVNVLTQIGLGYCFLYLVLGRGPVVQGAAALGILGVYWLAFYLYPAPGRDFDFAAVGVPENWPHFSGLAAHWDKNSNFAAAVDVWFLNLFPRSEPFRFNEGGYQTLNFVPSLATMIFGVMAGELLRRPDKQPMDKLRVLGAAAAACLAIGMAVDHTIWPAWLARGLERAASSVWADPPGFFRAGWTLCPIVKRIWTPSWSIFSTGWTLGMLAAFYWVIDVRGYRRWAFPFVVVGMNSIAMYCMAQLMKGWVRNTLSIHFGLPFAALKTRLGLTLFDAPYDAAWMSALVLLVLWLFCFWMYRKRIFVRI